MSLTVMAVNVILNLIRSIRFTDVIFLNRGLCLRALTFNTPYIDDKKLIGLYRTYIARSLLLDETNTIYGQQKGPLAFYVLLITNSLYFL